MIVRGKKKDYYDSILAWGVDKTVVYARDERQIEIKRKSHDWRSKEFSIPGPDKAYWKGKDTNLAIHYFVIGFCGKLYPVVEFRLNVTGGHRSQFFYDVESVNNFLNKRGIKQDDYRYFWRDNFNVTTVDGAKNWFKTDHLSHLDKYFQQYKVPIFLLEYSDKRNMLAVLTLNPTLREFQFFKVVEPTQAFQDVYSFISGVLGVPARPTVEVSDKIKAAKKGHNGKYSFRKPPTKHKK